MSDHSTYYGYFTPGIYDYPVTHSAISTPSAYSWEPILPSGPSSNWCSLPVQNNVTYVAGPLGGVINYVSDVDSHLALPTRQNVNSSLFYTTLPQFQEEEDEEEEMTSYRLQSLQSVPNFRQMHEDHFTNDEEAYGFAVPLNGFCLALPPGEEKESESEPDQASEKQQKSTVVITDVSESKATQAKVIPKRKKRTHKRIYKSKQGYLVEEPTSELSDEEGAAP
ncbi:uncharacterized protein LOC110191128 [Drosophila serrata]|uniref:uncharacterized protein LOC110191128 n=1 Tax=Drosophila serrata TaxID=7274 RepID=UPI000A1D02FA|nr:uncharacterized protein LOC110191128 [Drosophila serrata]